MKETDNVREGEKLTAISLLRVTAAVAVVFLHSGSTLLENPDLFHLTGSQKTFFQICHMLSVWTVPCFFMITGCLLLDEKRDLTAKDCVFKYANRMLLTLGVFGIPMARLILLFETKSLSFSMLGEAVYMALSGKTLSHLWYLYAMVGIYLVLPLLKRFTDTCSKELLDYILIVLFVMDFCIPFFNRLFQLALNFRAPLGGYVFYVLCGRRFRDFLRGGGQKKVFYLLAALGSMAVLLIALTVLYGGQDTIFPYLVDYKSPLTAIYSVLIFVLFGSLKPRCNRNALWKLDRLCFGVYLIHPVLIQTVYRVFRITPVHTGCYPVALFGFAAGFAIASFLGAWVLSLVKPLKKYIL